MMHATRNNIPIHVVYCITKSWNEIQAARHTWITPPSIEGSATHIMRSSLGLITSITHFCNYHLVSPNYLSKQGNLTSFVLSSVIEMSLSTFLVFILSFGYTGLSIAMVFDLKWAHVTIIYPNCHAAPQLNSETIHHVIRCFLILIKKLHIGIGIQPQHSLQIDSVVVEDANVVACLTRVDSGVLILKYIITYDNLNLCYS